MALTRTTAAIGEQFSNTEVTVIVGAGTQYGYLPANGTGSGSTVAADFAVTVFNDTDSPFEVRVLSDRRVHIIGPRSAATFLAWGDATNGGWTVRGKEGRGLQLRTSDFATNASGVPTLSSTLPAGATTASSKWIKVTAETGVAYLIAAWTA